MVSFHGTLAAARDPQPGMVKSRILVLNGDADRFNTPQQIETFKQKMKSGGADLAFFSYPGAMHSFTNSDATELGEKFRMPIAYNADADRKSWDKMKIFLDRVVKR